jgi:hypothetical protein
MTRTPSQFRASPKQRAYFHSLTGETMPFDTSKSKASSLIAKALRGEITRKVEPVKVYGWRFSGLAAECLKPEFKVTKYAVDQGYARVASFDTLAEAEAFARSRFDDAAIEVSPYVREQYMD